MSFILRLDYKLGARKGVFFLMMFGYCQAQFKFSYNSVQFELRLSLKPGYYHPHPTRESRDTAVANLTLSIEGTEFSLKIVLRRVVLFK